MRPAGPPRIAVSRSRTSDQVLGFVTALSAIPVPMGSAEAKAIAVVRGEVDADVHSGGRHDGIPAPPVAVAASAGLHVSLLDGSPLRYNQPNPTCRTW
ncbi:hypothetical protein [Nocardia rhamnosiphila]|uniref:Uncharacterized protein n=1 Tax=Nocardia rhamnosiphila TaxID=426716 RepID=A0ABV2WRM3_9NOCA